MLRTLNAQPTLWDMILPEQCLGLPPGLAEVDRLLDDERFFEPFRPFFDPRIGRPSIPMETYVRLMFLRFRYRLGYETLCAEVADSLAWRRFCRIPLGERVPHPSTVEKITKRCGPSAIDELNGTLLAKAAENKVLRTEQVRADTTVVPANVTYPSDAGLLNRGVGRLCHLTNSLKDLGLAARTQTRNRTRSMRRRAHSIAMWLRRRNESAKEEVMAITAEMTTIAESALAEAQVVARNARRSLRQAGKSASGKALSVLAELERTIAVLEQVVTQTKMRVAGQMPSGATRVVSLHDSDARPIAKGRIGKPVEFGFKAQMVDNIDGIVLDHNVIIGNPSDAPLLALAIARIKARFGRAPKTVAADRGYGEARVDDDLEALGVKHIYIPRRGRPGAKRQQLQQSRRFVAGIKWRTGCEGRIAHLKRNYGWSRTLMDGLDGTQTWCGWGVLTHNAVKISGLIATNTGPPGQDNGP
jgi:transposase, IS5 family